jgi:DNA integrity scanning protein DisA with diadenylate cyclase activity/mannitol/fructose-specific phosphotransferase system IIA component (Ntr-type)
MRLEKIIARSRVIDLRGTDMRQALGELLTVSLSRFPDLKQEALLRDLIQRESTMTTYLGKGVALPHVRARLGRRYILAIGRSKTGVHHDGTKSDEPARLVIMLLADEKARDYLQVLTAIARLMDDAHFVRSLIDAPTLNDLHERLFSAFGGTAAKPAHAARQSRVNRMMTRQAGRMARGAGCNAIMVFGDTFSSLLALRDWPVKMRSILVTRAPADPAQFKGVFENVIQVRTFSKQRLAQLRSAILVGITRGVLNFTDRVCCLGGIAGSNQLDAVVLVDVGREFQTLLTQHTDLLPDDVKPEVLERVLGIATELAVEGREGRPVGCLFVIGDTARVDKLTKPLVMNPFYGYKEEDRNILNPFMDETLKEFSSIDGAFVIRGDGVVMSAGSLIQASDNDRALPGGLGSRHAAAAAISVVTQCIALAVSSSTGQVSLFRRGVMLPLMEKGKFSAI